MKQTWHDKHVADLSFGDKIADSVAGFIGSWRFIIIQSCLLALWAFFNTLQITHAFHFDEFPFVFMNLFMSAEAAFSTPLIMMAQNRAGDRDRHQAEEDYKTNREAKEEIETLQKSLYRVETEKLDSIVASQIVLSKAVKKLITVHTHPASPQMPVSGTRSSEKHSRPPIL